MKDPRFRKMRVSLESFHRVISEAITRGILSGLPSGSFHHESTSDDVAVVLKVPVAMSILVQKGQKCVHELCQ